MPWIEVYNLSPYAGDPPTIWAWQGTQHEYRHDRDQRCQAGGDRCEVCFGYDSRVRTERPSAPTWHIEQGLGLGGPAYTDETYEVSESASEYDDEVEEDPDLSDCDCDGVLGYNYVPESIVFMGEGDHECSRRGRTSYPSAPTDETFLGLEIEFEAVAGSLRRMVERAHESELGWCKHDGSLHYGAEFALFPMTYQRVADSSLAQTMEALRELGARAWQPGSCGLHIHVSTQAFSGRAHMWRFAAAHERMSAQLKRLAGRHNREWAKWADDSHVDNPATKIIAGKGCYSDRYLAVNFNPSGKTIELRFWKGSMWPGQVLGACAIEDALVEWTRHMTFAEVRTGITWAAFTQWAVENLPESQVNHIAILATRRNVARHALPTIVVERVENACV